MKEILITAYGNPAPQGSKIRGRYGMYEASRNLKPWREAVEAAARDQYSGSPLTGALCYHMTFTVPAPRKLPKGRALPSVRPDGSKLIRATEDALTTAGVWADDALVTDGSFSKRYPGQWDALSEPGVSIAIFSLDGDLDRIMTLLRSVRNT